MERTGFCRLASASVMTDGTFWTLAMRSALRALSNGGHWQDRLHYRAHRLIDVEHQFGSACCSRVPSGRGHRRANQAIVNLLRGLAIWWRRSSCSGPQSREVGVLLCDGRRRPRLLEIGGAIHAPSSLKGAVSARQDPEVGREFFEEILRAQRRGQAQRSTQNLSLKSLAS